MAYQSLYRRYRPQRFAEVRGQDHLVTALRNAVREGRVGHAYLFSGPRGTGKTTTARILAKALNCPDLTDGEPCGVCESCVAIQNGTSFDVHELDAASNNKVEEIRDLISKAALGTPGRTKVYILDEVHMLTAAASNALLKTLEEPPEHVVFVLATTDPQKVLPTIRSRTQHYEVHLLSAEELTALATYIIDDAGLEVPDGAVEYVVNAGRGSARDMESALDQVAAAGTLPRGTDVLDQLIDALAERDTGAVLLAVDQAIQDGRAPRALGDDLMGRLRDVFLCTMDADLARLGAFEMEKVVDQAKRLGARGATRALEALGEAFVGIQDAPDPRITLEVALVRLTRPEVDVSPAALLDRIERLERGGVRSAPAEEPSAPAAPAPTPKPSPSAPEPTAAEAPAPTPAPEPAPAAKAGRNRPASMAREVLAERTGSRGPSERTSIPKPTRAKAPPTPAPAAEAPEPAPPAPAPKASADAGAPTGDLPTRDDLTLAWGDQLFEALSNKARARFGAGRWLESDGTALVYGLPNDMHRSRCEECKTDVEAVLEEHYGRPLPIRLVVDDGAPASPVTGASVPSAPTEPDDVPPDTAAEPHDDLTGIDVRELADADVGATGAARVAEMFPGAELVEEPDA